MDVSCDLEVDVNGEEVFMIDKKTISLYCGRIRKLFGKSKSTTRNLKVIFHDFPGGPENFELVSRFCYSNGKIDINTYTAPPLYCAAHFMEMNESVSGNHSLLKQTEKSLEEIKFWSWPELLAAFKQFQELAPISNSSGMLQKCLDSLVGRLVFTSEMSPSCPSTSSPDSSGFRLSTDSKSTESLRNGFLRSTWWFEDLVTILTPNLVQILVKSMVLQKFDHGLISRFLIYYQKSRFIIASSDEKREITEAVVDSLCLLDQTSVSCKSLFGILRVALNLNIRKSCKNNLEAMIGCQLDQATLDNLLVPSPQGSNYLYDVNLVLRFLKCFLIRKGGQEVPLSQMKKVASLMDSYIAEVAPDPRLKPFKFLALVKALPDAARDSYNEIYHAMDTYLQVHTGLSEEEKMSLCHSLNYDKLSSETCNHLTQNKLFPSRSATLALKAQQIKLENLLRDTNLETPFIGSPCMTVEAEQKDEKDQIVLYAGKLDLASENEEMRAHLQGMQWRVAELEKVCRKMQTQMSKMMKSRLSSQSSARSLPRLCS